jgi:hypothetical protein
MTCAYVRIIKHIVHIYIRTRHALSSTICVYVRTIKHIAHVYVRTRHALSSMICAYARIIKHIAHVYIRSQHVLSTTMDAWHGMACMHACVRWHADVGEDGFEPTTTSASSAAMAMAMAMSGEEILEHFRLRLRQLHACSLPTSLHVVSLPSPPPNLSLFPGATSYQGFPATFPLRPPLGPPISTSFAPLASALQGMLSGVLQVRCLAFPFSSPFPCINGTWAMLVRASPCMSLLVLMMHVHLHSCMHG